MATKPHYDADPSINVPETENGFNIPPRKLNIVWGNESRYWRLPSDSTPYVELIQVSWLEVTGSIDLSAGEQYEVTFKVSLASDAFGWNGCPVYVMAKFGKKGKYTWKRATLDKGTTTAGEVFSIPDPSLKITASGASNETTTLYFGLYEVWSGKWKGGLRIHEALVKKLPKTTSTST
ncbi:protein PHLOEM PROTEIN 2-LIKE A9-like [Corylus avellana]|uniref:protein PHLOEM PROTEIN 2-LIKE A9-like n=1 Tax=Corylus avellana TaxID=13451 RepID=UPI001E2271F3|nr:protein PHLOEM PROTEIN 2-LIKE A9-like [Corylus avellana]